MQESDIEKMKQGRASLKNAWLVLLPLLFSLSCLFYMVEYTTKSHDYKAYERAAMAVIRGTNPYAVRPAYIYPPLPAQAIASVYRVIAGRFLSPKDGHWDTIWRLIFDVYQCTQYVLLLLAYFLSYMLARSIGLRRTPALLLVTALMLVNYPLARTLKFNQVNLWILNSFLAALLLLRRYPLVSGAAIALGVHIKLYPLILLVPWTVTKKGRALLGAAFAFILILFVQTDWGRNFDLWREFLQYVGHGLQQPTSLKNNSFHSFVYNLFRQIHVPLRLAGKFSLVPVLGVLVWCIARFIKREKIYAEVSKTADPESKDRFESIFRCHGHAMDAIALSLLVSPSVWEHHYVIAIPIAIWAIGACRRDRIWIAATGAFLIFCLPTFLVFPFSYNRLAGLLLLVYLTSPGAVVENAVPRSHVSMKKDFTGADRRYQ
jgi:hypothetical protein